jgi:methyl-accepting chemotaxis protein
VLGGSYIGTLNTINDTVKASNDAVKLATDMQADLLRMNALLGVLNTDPASAVSNVQNGREITQLATNFGTSSATYQSDYQITTSGTMKSIRDTLQGNTLGTQASISQHSMIYVVNLQWQIYNSAQNRVLKDVQNQSNADTLSGDVAQANLEYLPLKGNLDNLVGLTESISQVVSQINTFKINPTLFWTIVAFFFSTLVVFALSYLINLTITRPLRRLVRLTERIAQGETDARAFLTGHDETYMVATSMNTMLDSIVKLMQNVQHQHNFLEARVRKLIAEIKGFGAGDLRTRAEVTADELGFLAHSLNYTIDELSGLVARVKTATDEVESFTRTTQTHVTQLAKSSDEQTQLIVEAAEAVEGIAGSATTIAEQAHILTSLAQRTRRAAQAVHEASTGDNAGREQGSRVTDSMLDEIEQQTQMIENIETSLSQQILLSRRALRSVQKAVDANKKRGACVRDASRQVGKLTHLVEDLRASVDVFKIQEKPTVYRKLN